MEVVYRSVAGIDEVGRGCLAGAVMAAAVILPEERGPLSGLADSKRLTPSRRWEIAQLIRDHAIAWSIGRVEPGEIDGLNIHRATLLAMQRAFAGLSIRPEQVLVDGRFTPELPCPATAVIGGDASVPAISAASILAKVCRDQEMQVMDGLFPGYGFAAHKGYPTATHLAALEKLGPCPMHRRSFGPVKKLLLAS